MNCHRHPGPGAGLPPTRGIRTMNRPVLDYYGKSFEELTGWANSDSVHPDDLPHVNEVRQKALEKGETYEVKSRHRRADGVCRWFHVRGLPLKDTDGRILRPAVLQPLH